MQREPDPNRYYIFDKESEKESEFNSDKEDLSSDDSETNIED